MKINLTRNAHIELCTELGYELVPPSFRALYRYLMHIFFISLANACLEGWVAPALPRGLFFLRSGSHSLNLRAFPSFSLFFGLYALYIARVSCVNLFRTPLLGTFSDQRISVCILDNLL